MNDTTTSDLTDFGHRERELLVELLRSWNTQGLPDDFYEDGVTFMMNRNSGFVFLTNSDYQVAMMNGNKLESFYSCPNCGHEGFKEDMAHKGGAECLRYLKDIGVISEEESEEEGK